MHTYIYIYIRYIYIYILYNIFTFATKIQSEFIIYIYICTYVDTIYIWILNHSLGPLTAGPTPDQPPDLSAAQNEMPGMGAKKQNGNLQGISWDFL